MSIRKEAINWLEKNFGVSGDLIYTSKFYTPDISWTGENAWWIHIPAKRVNQANNKYVNLLCQTSKGSNDFFYLKVPLSYIHSNLSQLTILKNGIINIFLSAQPQDRFQDKRSKSAIRFGTFLVNA
jgi:hypothetical protein